MSRKVQDLHYSNFSKMHWVDKIDYLEKIDKKELILNKKLTSAILNDPIAKVRIAGLRAFSHHDICIDERDKYIFFSDSWQMARYYFVNHFHKCFEYEEVPFNSLLKDQEWLVKEATLKWLRKYSQEQKEKNYYNRVITLIDSIQPALLRETYRTLNWYNEPRSFSYMVNRFYYAENSALAIIILQEISKFDSPLVERLLVRASLKNKNLIVREEARRLLRGL